MDCFVVLQFVVTSTSHPNTRAVQIRWESAHIRSIFHKLIYYLLLFCGHNFSPVVNLLLIVTILLYLHILQYNSFVFFQLHLIHFYECLNSTNSSSVFITRKQQAFHSPLPRSCCQNTSPSNM